MTTTKLIGEVVRAAVKYGRHRDDDSVVRERLRLELYASVEALQSAAIDDAIGRMGMPELHVAFAHQQGITEGRAIERSVQRAQKDSE